MATVCRLAREEDYEAVANIDTDVYGGLDYLPARFHFYLTSPNHYPFVMEHEGEIVAYMYRYVVDDGNAVIGGAARVRADLRGNGLIYRKLVEFVDKQIASLHPRAVHRRLYVAPNTPIQQNLIKKGKVEVILHRAFTHHCISMDIVRRQVHESRFMILRRNYNVEQVTSPGKDEFVKLMLSSKELFPGDSFIAFLEPYRPMKSNFTYVAENYVCHVTHKQGNGASAVSFLTYVPCKAGLRVDMEVYVTNVNILIQHVLKSLEYLSTLKYECDIQYCVYFPNDLNKQQLEQLMVEELCWKTGSFAKYGTYFALRKILNISQL